MRSRDVDQQHLKLDLTINLDDEEFHGRALWTVSPFKPVRTVELDAAEMKIDKVALGDGAKPETMREVKFQKRTNTLEITLDREYAAGEILTLAIDYKVSHPQKGGHFVVPDDSEPNRRRSFWTQGEPDDARYWLPCIDSPTDRFTSEVNITAPKQYQAISNGILRHTDDNADGTRTFHWEQEQTSGELFDVGGRRRIRFLRAAMGRHPRAFLCAQRPRSRRRTIVQENTRHGGILFQANRRALCLAQVFANLHGRFLRRHGKHIRHNAHRRNAAR